MRSASQAARARSLWVRAKRRLDALAALDHDQLVAKGVEAMRYLDHHAQLTRQDDCYPQFANLVLDIERLTAELRDALTRAGRVHSRITADRKYVTVKVRTRSGTWTSASLSISEHMRCVDLAIAALRENLHES